MMMWMCSFLFLLLGRIKMENESIVHVIKTITFRLRWNLYLVRPPTPPNPPCPPTTSTTDVLDAK